MREKVTAIFDVGKTNKKLLLFNDVLGMVSESEEKFPSVTDEDGFECDDIELIERWIRDSVSILAASEKYDLQAVNFTTYGASVVYLDEHGKRTGPLYNYLKPMDERIPESLYKRNGGRDEFCRRTASPALGMLNSGLQPLWLKKTKPEFFSGVKHVLHFPQYLSYLLTGKMYSEHTSIGCHTSLWDFDNMKYHPWVESLGVCFPEPSPVGTSDIVEIGGKKIRVGIGIHDSSAALVPYFKAAGGRFILLSTGTWLITMHPFNEETLTAEQLDNDCLCYMSINGKAVKSSRLFLGNIHDRGASLISRHFGKADDHFRKIIPDWKLSVLQRKKFEDREIFFKPHPESREFREKIDLYDFASFEEAYHQFMNELGIRIIEAINLVMPENDNTSTVYITGGFSKNRLFLNTVKEAFQDRSVFISEISNGSALGAALVLEGSSPVINLGLTECRI